MTVTGGFTTTKRFWLKPFTPIVGSHRLDVVGRVSREKNLLTVSYEILGALHQLISTEETPEAWSGHTDICQQTCLECFIAPAQSDHYWEFELTPDLSWIDDSSQNRSSGWDFQVSSNHNWQVSRFENYRQNPHPEHSIKTISYSMLSAPKALHTLLKIDLEKMLLADCKLSVGIAAVTQFAPGPSAPSNMIYWALNHPNNKPDFHHRDSFALAV